jgi:DNA polymerase-3 subunit gamma/tau
LSLALARKYRPSSFDDLVGQDAVSQTLSLALEGDRLSHAYLFSGLRGSGKTSTARIFAKALLCESGPTSKPCNTCTHCKAANTSSHMDIIEMDAASNRGIDDIKELIEHTKYKPSTGRYKIFIIDEVHMLTTQAFNALLKTLEEPPDFVKFILATTDPLKLPATILSRTQHFRFKKIPQKLVMNHLQHILDRENVEYDKEALEIIARSGAGSLRDSLTLLDQAIVYSKNHVDVATITNMLGIIEPSLLDAVLNDIQNKDDDNILAFIRQAGDFEAEMIIDELTLHLKALLLGKDTRFAPMVIDRFFRILADAKELLGLGSDGEFVLSLTLFKMMESLAIRDIDAMIHTLQKELSGVKIPGTSTSQPLQATKPNQTTETAPPIEKEIDLSTIAPEVIAHMDPVTSKPAASESAPETDNDTAVVQTAAPRKEEEPTSTAAVLQFKNLLQKIYDRDYDLGSCFERNITFMSYEEPTLTWLSSAEGSEKKTLIHGWGIIRMFAQEVFGIKTAIVNVPHEAKQEEVKKKIPDPATILSKTVGLASADHTSQPPATNTFAQSASTIEAIEMPDSCVAPEAGQTEAAKEKDPSTLLQEPMIQEIIHLFDPKKVRIVRKS